MKHPVSENEHTHIELLCKAHQAAVEKLPDGCMPGAMCALARQSTDLFFTLLALGVFLGIVASRFYNSLSKKK